jgi:hypothetical protein
MITERAMLAAVHISIWTAVKHDSKVSREVAARHGAYDGAGRYNKQLLREAERLKRCARSPGRFASTSTRSRCPGPMRAFACCPRTSTSS